MTDTSPEKAGISEPTECSAPLKGAMSAAQAALDAFTPEQALAVSGNHDIAIALLKLQKSNLDRFEAAHARYEKNLEDYTEREAKRGERKGILGRLQNLLDIRSRPVEPALNDFNYVRYGEIVQPDFLIADCIIPIASTPSDVLRLKLSALTVAGVIEEVHCVDSYGGVAIAGYRVTEAGIQAIRSASAEGAGAA